MSQSPHTVGSPLSSPDGTSRSSGLEDESGQISLDRKLRRELRKRQREQKHLEIEMELERQAEERRKERSATLKKIEEGEEKEEAQYQELAKKIKRLQEEGDKERQKYERELEEEILKTRKAREERRRSSSVLVASSEPSRSSRRNSVDLLTSRSPRSPTRTTHESLTKLESSEIVSPISEVIKESSQDDKIDTTEVLSSSPPNQLVDAQEKYENSISPKNFSCSNDDEASAESNVTSKRSGDEDESPISPTKASHADESETSTQYKSIDDQTSTQEKPSATSSVTEIKDIGEKLLENNLDSNSEIEMTIENKDSALNEGNSGNHDIPGKKTAPLPRLKPKKLNSDPLPTNNKSSDSVLVDEYEKIPKLPTDPPVKEEIETEKKDLPKIPGRLNVNELFKEKESNTPPPRSKPEPPRKKTSLFAAMFEEAEKKNHEGNGSSRPLSTKKQNPVTQTIVTTTVETTEVTKVSEKGVETVKLEMEKTSIEIPTGHENPKIEIDKKGDLPRVPGKLNVKEFFKEKEGNTSPLKLEPQRKKISLVGTAFEDLQKKNESNSVAASKPPIIPTGKRFVGNSPSTATTTTTTTVSSVTTNDDDGSSKPQVGRKAVLGRLPWMAQKSDDTSSTSANPSKGPVPRKLASSFLTPVTSTAITTEQSKPKVPSKLDNSISQRLEGVLGGKMPFPGMGRRKVSHSGEDSDTGRVKVMMGTEGSEKDETAAREEATKSEEVSVNSSAPSKPLNHITKDRPRPPGRSRPPTRPIRVASGENENKKLDSTESKSVTTPKDEKGVECVENTNSESMGKSNEQTLETINVEETLEKTSVSETS